LELYEKYTKESINGSIKEYFIKKLKFAQICTGCASENGTIFKGLLVTSFFILSKYHTSHFKDKLK
jgi:hypothetical protein